MLALALFLILLYQRVNIERIIASKPGKDLALATKKANIGLVLLGILAIVQFSVNIHLDQSLWNADFFSFLFD